MLGNSRWVQECYVMDVSFPQYKAFSANGTVGFEGKLAGPRTKRIYDVKLAAPVRQFPESMPATYISPHPEEHHWLAPDRRLCAVWGWNPAKHTFRDVLLVAIKYIDEFD